MDKIKTLTGQEAIDELTRYFLGEDYYIADPLRNIQANPIIVDEIKEKYKNEKSKYRVTILILANFCIIEAIIIGLLLR